MSYLNHEALDVAMPERVVIIVGGAEGEEVLSSVSVRECEVTQNE